MIAGQIIRQQISRLVVTEQGRLKPNLIFFFFFCPHINEKIIYIYIGYQFLFCVKFGWMHKTNSIDIESMVKGNFYSFNLSIEYSF